MESNIFTSLILPIALGTMMLGMGLSLVPEDFQRVGKYPKAVGIGLISQLLVLPLIGLAIAKLVPMEPAIATGLMILALCPGGVSSNLVTFLAMGDVALSVTLTALSSLITVFTIPIFANLASQHFFGQGAVVELPIGTTIGQIFAITFLPIIIGMSIRQFVPKLSTKIEKVTSISATVLLAVIILLLIIKEWSRLPNFIVQVGIGVLLLNTLSMAAGFYLSKLFNLNYKQQICISIEVGMQNGTLAIAITAGLLNNPDMAVPGAIYSLLMYLTGCMAIVYGRNLSASRV
ncbi:bile acid:sodium symporter family protein [Cylindrospermopsis raciborskii]|uniref:Bile acid:sodium symporter family protein n=2 Tax=Cylindrospermopsis raciborskii TaxID=77022 RepID=A0A838WS37_9CYAN|nr:bile acid:sodium symporter family protein [Cylindrospermopsis raciborskii]MBA4447139.1 bile acid:sodium symporter family protein [Cylindrospermopsis raciborskii CS-506_C]MBA4451409.1 bile acid:sodium symporter family protein [Cylindrospermopsis raciborskii CS-506_D]MBA4458000.1 bile acid:sodium symporter family protein [Cylindrospermopsis raciborskii CS-506_B]MBA4467387.1 bile acid:sodium symporter family protein [Cylindrospermopsis raciborskii CS-506_A]OHY34266.1 bile acid:sodium symporter